jgi:hypothetical protein
MLTLRQVLHAANIAGMAHNNGAGGSGEFILVGTEAQLIQFGEKVRDAQRAQLEARIKELEEEVRIDDQLLATRNALLDAIPACPEHGSGCVPHAMEWVEQMLAKPTDAKWVAMFNRRVAIEQLMYDASRGKRPMPDAKELREWALKLGTPHDWNADKTKETT